MDDTPSAFFQELRDTVLRRSIGRIALAVLLALALLQLLNAIVVGAIFPILAYLFDPHHQSALFRDQLPIPRYVLGAYFMQFVLAVIVVFYGNRWLFRPKVHEEEEAAIAESDPSLNVDLGSLAASASGDTPEPNQSPR